MTAALRPNEEIELFSGRMRLTDAARSATGRGRVWLAWQPMPRIRFSVALNEALAAERITVSFASNRRRASAAALVTSTSIAMSRKGVSTRLDGFFTEDVNVGAGRRIAFITFDLPNMPELDGHLAVTAGNWHLTLTNTGTKESFEALRRDGGYCLTATATLARASGAAFDRAAVDDVLDSIRTYLSFAIGMWTQPLLVTGYDATDAPVWRRWGVSRVSQWDVRPRWLPVRNHKPAVDLFAAWQAQWLDPYWREVFGRVTYFFVDANRPFVDLGLVISQSALETLSYAISVIAKKSVSASAFDARGYTATHKIRGLLADVGLLAAVPPELPALLRFSPDPTFTDGPSKVTYLRNRLVHPLKTVRNPAGTEIVDAWRLALWYIEASLLAFLGYAGVARSRITGIEALLP